MNAGRGEVADADPAIQAEQQPRRGCHGECQIWDTFEDEAVARVMACAVPIKRRDE